MRPCLDGPVIHRLATDRLTSSPPASGAMTSTSTTASPALAHQAPQFDRVFAALQASNSLIITTLDRPGRSTQNMLVIAEELRGRGAGLRVLNLGGARTDGTRDQARASDSTQRGSCAHERVVERVSDNERLRRVAHGDCCVCSTSCASRWGRGPVPSLVKTR